MIIIRIFRSYLFKQKEVELWEKKLIWGFKIFTAIVNISSKKISVQLSEVALTLLLPVIK